MIDVHLAVEVDGEEQAVCDNDGRHQHETTEVREQDPDGENVASSWHSGGDIVMSWTCCVIYLICLSFL